MIAKKISEISLDDINLLIENEVGENKSLEYKSELHLESRDEKKEFLADITAFANADGGDIIFGVKEDAQTGLPVELVGICVKSVDDIVLKVENLLRDSVSPRIPTVVYKALNMPEDKIILIIRIDASYLSPHRVIYGGFDKFFSRNSKGKYPMDVDELRSSFIMSHTLYQSIDNYLEEKLIVISQNKNRELLKNKPFFVFQFIPVSAFRNNDKYSIEKINNSMETSRLNTDDSFRFTNNRIIVDGIVTGYKIEGSQEFSRKIHLRSNGIIEMSTTDFFFPQYTRGEILSKPYDVFSSGDMVKCCISLTDKVKTYYSDIGIASPIVLSCAILNGMGYSLPRGSGAGLMRGNYGNVIDREFLIIPTILIKDFEQATTQMLKPMFDSIWNAFGQFCCPAYDSETGEYVGLSDNELYF